MKGKREWGRKVTGRDGRVGWSRESETITLTRRGPLQFEGSSASRLKAVETAEERAADLTEVSGGPSYAHASRCSSSMPPSVVCVRSAPYAERLRRFAGRAARRVSSRPRWPRFVLSRPISMSCRFLMWSLQVVNLYDVLVTS